MKLKKETYKYVQGWTSETTDDLHVGFFDYDHRKLVDVIRYCENVMIEYKLSDFYIFSTEKGYHAVCLNMFPLKKWNDILKKSRTDKLFRTLGFNRGFWILRLSKKYNSEYPKYIMKIKGYRKHETSKAHKRLVLKLIKMEVRADEQDKKKQRKTKKIVFVSYLIPEKKRTIKK